MKIVYCEEKTPIRLTEIEFPVGSAGILESTGYYFLVVSWDHVDKEVRLLVFEDSGPVPHLYRENHDDDLAYKSNLISIEFE